MNYRFVSLILFISLFEAHFSNAQSDSTEASKLSDLSVFWILSEDYHKAIVLLDSAIQYDSLNVHAYANRASAYDGLGLVDMALADANKSIALDSLNANLYYNRGLIYKNALRYSEAVEDFEKAIDLDEWHILATLKLAYYHYQVIGNNKEAIKVIEHYLFHGTSGKKEEAELLGLYGFLKLDKGDFTGAVMEFDLSIHIDSTRADAYYNRGLAHYNLKNLDKAIADHSKAIALEPEHFDAYYNRALAYSAQRKFDLAVNDYTKDLQLNGPKANTFNNRGRCYMVQGNYERAMNDFNLALEIEPDRAITIHNIGVLYLRQEQFDKGCEFLRKAKELGYSDQQLVNNYCQ